MKYIFFLYIFIFLLSLIITYTCEKVLIPILKKTAQQPIYEGGPAWHISKKGTPTMGGLAFLIAITVCALGSAVYFFYSKKSLTAVSIIISLLYSISNALVGVIDDITKLRRKENAGLTPLQKLFFQTILAVLFLMARKHYLDDSTLISFSFGEIDLGIFYYPFSLIILVGIVNCANLTDGIDGLAASVAASIAIAFSLICATFTDIAVLSAAMIGGTIGFLLFNRHPASIFMGDTGSLFLGSLAASMAFAYGNPFIIIALGIVYVAEGISVILQVLVFKLTKKRLFKMAPLHHHLEKSGYSENNICVIAVVVTVILSIISAFCFGVAK